jgi:hypothetical protein
MSRNCKVGAPETVIYVEQSGRTGRLLGKVTRLVASRNISLMRRTSTPLGWPIIALGSAIALVIMIVSVHVIARVS